MVIVILHKLIDVLMVTTKKGLIAKEDSQDQNATAYKFTVYYKKRR